MKYKFVPHEIKSFNDDDLWIEHFISTETKDRGGDIMMADGMQIDGVPVVLWQHGMDPAYGHMPIAKPIEFKIGTNKNGAKGIIAKTQYPKDEEGKKLYERTKAGYMPNWSIGYDGKGIPIDGGGMKYDEWTLFEYSNVAIPMNAEATHGSAPDVRQLSFKAFIEKAPDGYKDAYEFREKTEAYQAVDGYEETRKDSATVYGKRAGVWQKIDAPHTKPEPGKDESKEDFMKRCIPQVVNEGREQDQAIAICNSLWESRGKAVDVATTATGTDGSTKTLADEVKGDVAWMAMMTITDKFFTNLRGCEPKKPRIRKLFDEYVEAMLEHALAFCEVVSANAQAALVLKCETLSENLKSAQTLKKEKYDCECIECGHKMQSEAHCKDIKCPKCGGTMRRAERPGPGQKTEVSQDALITCAGCGNKINYSQISEIAMGAIRCPHCGKTIDQTGKICNQSAETPPTAPKAPAEEPAPPEPPTEQPTETPPEPPKALTVNAFRGKQPALTIGDVKQALADAMKTRDEQLIKTVRTKILGRLD